MEHLQEAASGVTRNTADAEALQNEGVVVLQHVRRETGRDAGDQLEQPDPFIEPVIEYRGLGKACLDVLQKPPVLHHGKTGIVDAGECLIALGARFAGACALNDLAVEDDHDAMQMVGGGTEERVRQIDLGVGRIEADGLLRAGQDDRLFCTLNEVGERRCRIRHCVGAVADDKAVVALIMLLHSTRQRHPVFRADVGGVETEQLHTIDFAEFGDLRHEGQKLLRGEGRPQAILTDLRSDGAAGADHENLFHKKPPAFRS